MKLTKNEFLIYMSTYMKMCEEEEQVVNVLGIDFENTMSHWIDNYYNLISDLCELKDEGFGSTLDWWCFETDFGKRNAAILNEDGTVFFEIPDAAALYDYLVNVEIPRYWKEPTNGTNFFN